MCLGAWKTIFVWLDVASPDTLKQDKHNKSFSLLWELWSLSPQRHILFSYWKGALEKIYYWQIFESPFVRSLFFALWKPYWYSCHLFGPVTFCHFSKLEWDSFWCLWIWKRLFSAWYFFAKFGFKKPTVENLWAYWILLDH